MAGTSPPRVQPEDYSDFRIATPKAASAAEAAACQPARPGAPAHDAFTRLSYRLEPDPESLWLEAKGQVDLAAAVLALDDTVLDKPFARHLDLAGRWYASLENLEHLRALGWGWLTRLKGNRLVNEDRQGQRPPSRADIAATGTEVRLTGLRAGAVFKVVAPDGDRAYWATSDLPMTDLTRRQMAGYSRAIETYHRGTKQFTEVERGQARGEGAQRSHTGLALRAFLRLEYHLFSPGISWAAAKAAIIRDAVRSHLAHPSIRLPTA